MSTNYKPLKVYKSSAGSGKTTTLALEYLNLALGKGDQFRHILALTFTNKAAQEMKDRILDYLQKIIDFGNKPNSDEPFFYKQLISESAIYQNLSPEKARQKITNDAQFLYKNLIHKYSEYAVTTIDSFTNRVIKSFSHDLGLSFNYQVELKTNLLIDLAIEELLSRINNEDSILTNILSKYSKSKIDQEKSRNIRRDLQNRARSLLNDLEEEYLVELRQLSLEELQAIQVKIDQSVNEFEKYLEKPAKAFLQICKNQGIEKSSFYSRAAIYNYFSRIANADFSQLEPNITTIKTINENKWTAGKVSTDQLNLIESSKAEFIQLFEEIQLAIESFSDYKLKKEISKHYYPFMILVELEKILNQMKSEQQMIHISDFNKMISKSVAHESAPYIYERIGNKYQNYLLDEFQDTSVLQWHNLLPLVENGISQNYFSMVVGDAKQSIYRWRGSDVQQFSEFPKILKSDNDEYMIQRQSLLNQSFQEINLVTNYRTGKNIVDFNNNLFRFIQQKNYLSEELGKIYESSTQKIDQTDTDSFVQIHSIETKNIDKEETDQEYIEKVYQVIKQSRDDGYQLKEIAVLARKNKLLIEIARYLLEKGIPVISTESLHADSSPLVKFILSLINYLYFPTESLYQSEIIYFLSEYEPFKSKIDFKSTIETNNAENKLSDFLEDLNIKLDAKSLINSNTYEAIEQLCSLFSLDKTDSLLHFFLEAAFVFSQEYHQDLSHFLEWWNLNAEDYKLDVPEDWEAVKLLSFHKAKGLEFPVVINLFSDNHFNESNWMSPEIWLNPNIEDVPNLKSFPFKINNLKDTQFNDIYEREKDFEKLDKINLFYVAMTRPKERLHLLADVFHPGKSDTFKFSEVIDGFIQAESIKEIENQTFQFGELNQVRLKNKEADSAHPNLKNFDHSQWKSAIPMSLDTDDEKLAAADWGTKVHRFFAQIKSEEDLQNHLDQSKIKLHLSENESAQLVEQAKQVLQHPQISKLYKAGNLILNERDFYTSTKKILRPDRIVKIEDQFYILDYKTGKKTVKNEKQIREYCTELEKISGLKTQAFLVYLHEELEVIAVS